MPIVIALWIQAFFVLVRAFFLNFFTRLWAFILFLAPVLFNKIFVLLGIGFASYKGLDIIITKLQNFVLNSFNGLPSDIFQLCLLAKFDVGLKIIFACMGIAVSIKIMSKSASLVRTTPESN